MIFGDMSDREVMHRARELTLRGTKEQMLCQKTGNKTLQRMLLDDEARDCIRERTLPDRGTRPPLLIKKLKDHISEILQYSICWTGDCEAVIINHLSNSWNIGPVRTYEDCAELVFFYMSVHGKPQKSFPRILVFDQSDPDIVAGRILKRKK